MANESVILHSDLNCYYASVSYALFLERWAVPQPIRALTIRGINPRRDDALVQTDLFSE